MITQTLALLVAAYRELNARKLFWITMVLSGLAVSIFAAIGIDEEGMSLAGMRIGFIPVNTDIIPRDVFYKIIFINLGIGIWLTWAAAILALVSTSGIMPEMVSSGSIDTMISKPISRFRLFLTKYVLALLFVALQVGVFSLACFLVIGFRGGAWEAGIFLAIPIVIAFFSFLYCFCALVGIVTRSTIAALLLTILFWLLIFVANAADAILVQFREQFRYLVEEREARIELMIENTRTLIRDAREDAGEDPGVEITIEEVESRNPFLGRQRDKLESNREDFETLRFWSGLIFSVKTVLPKTGETIALLERHLIDLDDIIQEPDEDIDLEDLNEDIEVDAQIVTRRTQEVFRSRSVAWVLGTSFAFEAVMLGIAGLIFARRDF